MENWTKVLETTDLQHAELMRSVLINEGIEAVIINQKDSSYTVFGSVLLYVPDEFVAQASEILKNSEGE